MRKVVYKITYPNGKIYVGKDLTILTASDPLLPLQSPIATIVEAKKNDIEAGLGQCIAQMVAADQFNRAAGLMDAAVFCCVTTGEVWQFLQLTATEALLDRNRYYIDDINTILGALLAIIAKSLSEKGTVPLRFRVGPRGLSPFRIGSKCRKLCEE